MAGRAALMSQRARRVPFDPRSLLARAGLLACLATKRRQGTPLVLVSDTDRETAEAVARGLGIFDTVIALGDGAAPAAERRRDRLLAEFGPGGFDHQWAKTLLLLLPVVAAHRFGEAGLMRDAPLGVHDIHGNAAERMNLPVTPEQMASELDHPLRAGTVRLHLQRRQWREGGLSG